MNNETIKVVKRIEGLLRLTAAPWCVYCRWRMRYNGKAFYCPDCKDNPSTSPLVRKVGRPLRDIDMTLARTLLDHLSIRKTATFLGVPFNTLCNRLKREGFTISTTNPMCVACRVRMRHKKGSKGSYYICPQCSASTRICRKRPKSHRRGRPPLDFDIAKASELLQTHPVIEVAEMLGVHRNVLYARMKAPTDIRVSKRPYRTWVPRRINLGWFAPK